MRRIIAVDGGGISGKHEKRLLVHKVELDRSCVTGRGSAAELAFKVQMERSRLQREFFVAAGNIRPHDAGRACSTEGDIAVTRSFTSGEALVTFDLGSGGIIERGRVIKIAQVFYKGPSVGSAARWVAHVRPSFGIGAVVRPAMPPERNFCPWSIAFQTAVLEAPSAGVRNRCIGIGVHSDTPRG